MAGNYAGTGAAGAARCGGRIKLRRIQCGARDRTAFGRNGDCGGGIGERLSAERLVVFWGDCGALWLEAARAGERGERGAVGRGAGGDSIRSAVFAGAVGAGADGAFSVGAIALLALLPLISRPFGATGYGVLLGSFGGGALAGATILPRLRRQLSVDGLVAGAIVVFALMTFLAG